MKLKHFSAVLLCAVTVLFTAPPLARAQDTNQPPVPTSTGSFYQSAMSYFTSFNPELDSTFGTQRGEFAIGADSIQGGGVNLANSLRISYDVYKSISAEAVIRDSGISGIIVSEQVGPALNFVIHDAKLTLYAHAGHREEHPDKGASRLYGAIGVRAQKALTPHTFAFVSMEVQLPGQTRVFGAGTGFTF